ncbi:MAG: lysylphosphatidylglycerol synthase transmembrane domain-containing protein [Saprospiraceae bacterium]|nr:flippase-like domain-containing protein [Saprospiraceae bacterium]MDW8228549.1 lysylphosphatidylglycerol synthase transmembrane domain-containing protein [Saprospiraceae bacterium]
MSSIWKKVLRFLLFFGMGALLLALVFRHQNAAYQEQCRLDGIPAEECRLMDKLLSDFSSVHLGWMGLVWAAFTVSILLRAWRWQVLLEPMGYQARLSNAFWTIVLGYFANLGLPRMGEVVRAGALARYERIPVGQVMGTLVIDRLMDFVCLGLFVGLAFLWEGDTLWAFLQQSRRSEAPLWQSPGFWAVLGALAAGGGVLWFFRHKIGRLPILKKIASLIAGFLEGLRSVFRLQRAGVFLATSLGIWVMFYLQTWFNLKAFGPTSHLDLSATLMVFVFGTLGFVVPSPGGMGSFHALAMAGLALYAVRGDDAFSYANIAFFAVQIFYNVLGGLLALALLPLLNRPVSAKAPQHG